MSAVLTIQFSYVSCVGSDPGLTLFSVFATTYNIGSQPVQATWSANNGNAAKTRMYEYDNLSRIKKVSDGADGQIAWTYNTAGLVSNETTTMPSVGNALGNIVSSLNMSYDTVGRLSGKQLSVNGSVHYLAC